MTSKINEPVTGRCYCQKIHYQVSGPIRNVRACHCSQCQILTGSYVMASACFNENLTIIDKDSQLQWYFSSEDVKRGFCRCCGTQLFWQRENTGTTSIMAGSLDDTSYLELSEHIFYDDRAHYYEAHPDSVTFNKDETVHENKIDKCK